MASCSLVGTYHCFQEVILPYFAKISRCMDSTIREEIEIELDYKYVNRKAGFF